MNRKLAGSGAVGLALVLVVVVVVLRDAGPPANLPKEGAASAPGQTGLTGEVSALTAGVEPPESTSAAAAPPPDLPDTRPAAAPTNEQIDAWLEQRENKRLEAEGFSADRIAWIRRRAKQLRAQWTPGPATPQKYMLDKDLDLRFEIGDEEYERYRRALDRPAGIPVAEVLPGSAAEGAGLLPGDQIVGFGGKRVFNMGELDELLPAGTPGEAVMVEVRREGRTIHVPMPSGDLGIRAVDPVTYRMNLIEAREAEAGILPPVQTITISRPPFPRPELPWRNSPESRGD